MIDFESLPLPEGAPEKGACIRENEVEPGVLFLHLEPPHRPKLAVLDVPLLRDLNDALDRASSRQDLKALVIAGREPLSFAGGADVDAIGSIEDPELAARMVGTGQAVFQKLWTMGRTAGGRIFTIAAVGGPVPGGACELSLACDRIVLADDKRTRIGLPEVKLGIFPGWGGTQRLPRRTGVPTALDLILAGKLLPAKPALKRGVVDRITHAESLWRVATDIAAGRMKCARRERRGWQRWLVDKNPLAAALIASQARKSVMAKTKGHYPAPLAALPLVVRAPRVGLDEGLRDELDGVRPLVVSRQTKNLVRLFHLSEAAKKLGRLSDGSRPAPVARAAVIGAGVMGGGIASLMAEKRVEVRLRDLDQKQLDAAVLTHRRDIEKKRKKRRLERHEADAANDRLTTTTAAVGLGRCELAVEAVAEKLNVKRAVFGELAELLPDDAILATNTSSLSLDAIAEGMPGPERFVGMHFFNPVRLMPLVEVVRGTHTSDDVVARVAQLALSLGKTPVVVKDVAGFLVNRVLGPYLDEALRLLEAGADPEAMDKALVAFGMPMGPCELLDEIGLDIARHAGDSLQAAYGERMTACQVLAPALDAGELGKKTGKGIYLWTTEKGRPKKAGRNARLSKSSGAFTLGTKEIVDRLTLAMLNEAVRCLEECVVAGPGELDLATVFGTGFAPFRGGVLRYAEALGLSAVVERLHALRRAPDIAADAAHAARFAPAPLLETLAAAGKTFDDAD